MVWNHRVVKREFSNCTVYNVHEMYYNDDGEVILMGNEQLINSLEDLEDLREYLEWMLAACDEEVLDYQEVLHATRAEREWKPDDTNFSNIDDIM
jgi:hypothetical protein